MALFAKDQVETISAWDAVAGKLYECLECQTPLKLRLTRQKFPHFYHLCSSRNCRLYSKSKRHLLIQYAIQKKIPEVVLEKSFPSIQRIADVVWEEKQIIFEIQCSFIAEKEAQDRVKEYASLGYEVIWILFDARFNRKKVSLAEAWMRNRSCYFVDKQFVFYDQQEIIDHQKRIFRSRKIPIQLSPILTPLEGPLLLQHRIRNKYYFTNDLLDLALRSKIEIIQIPKRPIKEFLYRTVRGPYESFLNYLLKIDCGS
jgi:competence protein CoiA